MPYGQITSVSNYMRTLNNLRYEVSDSRMKMHNLSKCLVVLLGFYPSYQCGFSVFKLVHPQLIFKLQEWSSQSIAKRKYVIDLKLDRSYVDMPC